LKAFYLFGINWNIDILNIKPVSHFVVIAVHYGKQV